MRFHVVALPHTETTKEYLACAYTAKVINFCRMMKDRGHTVFLYGSENNEAPCDEHIVVSYKDEREKHIGDKHFTEASFDYRLPLWHAANGRAIDAINYRAFKKDFICVIGGIAQAPIANALPHLITVEFGIGYGGVFSKYRVFESYAWMHMVYGAQSGGDPHRSDGHWWDEVIPGYLDPNMFPFSAEKDDYYLYIGRLVDRKGYRIAVDACKVLGKRLVVCGQGIPPEGVDYRGIVGPEERGQLMSKAKAVFVPTMYVEPFANVHIEAQACGTPVITTDWGVFTETVLNGFNGFRCRMLRDFVEAAIKVEDLDFLAIRENAINLYSLDSVSKKYETYFNRLLTLWDDGWYA
jgi:glycosyltransferase involved in cell wall biosynthesis